jgi:hypothetical protein
MALDENAQEADALVDRRRGLLWIVGFPLFAALIVGAIGVVVAWLNIAGSIVYASHQFKAPIPYWKIDHLVEGFVEQNKRFPTSLDEVNVEFPALEIWNDPWRNPIYFRVQDNHWTLTSLGRDGKPGGTGFDADYTYNATAPSDLRPTLWQFLTDPDFRAPKICPLLTALVMWLTLVRASPRTRKGGPIGMRELVRNSLAMGAVAVVGGLYLAALHMPNGH